MKELSNYEKKILKELIRVDETSGGLTVLGNVIDFELYPNFYIEIKSEESCPVRIAKSFIDNLSKTSGTFDLNEVIKQFNNNLFFIVKLFQYLEHQELIYLAEEIPISILGSKFISTDVPVGYQLPNNETVKLIYYFSHRKIILTEQLKQYVKNGFKTDSEFKVKEKQKFSIIEEIKISKNADDFHTCCMKRAIELGKKSNEEDKRIHPLVGAVLVKDGTIIGESYRGEIAKGNHAEFTLLERHLPDKDLTGAILYSTLEPCTSRKHPKKPCADWIINRRIGTVYVGMLDPNPKIERIGVTKLVAAEINIHYFPSDLRDEIKKDNENFINYFSKEKREKRRIMKIFLMIFISIIIFLTLFYFNNKGKINQENHTNYNIIDSTLCLNFFPSDVFQKPRIKLIIFKNDMYFTYLISDILHSGNNKICFDLKEKLKHNNSTIKLDIYYNNEITEKFIKSVTF